MRRFYRKGDINIVSPKKAEENRDANPSPVKNKTDFKRKKDNTICSLYEVEHFLCNFKKFSKYAKIYYLLNK